MRPDAPHIEQPTAQRRGSVPFGCVATSVIVVVSLLGAFVLAFQPAARSAPAERGAFPVWDINGCAFVLEMRGTRGVATVTRSHDLDFDGCGDTATDEPAIEAEPTAARSVRSVQFRVPSEGVEGPAAANERGFREFFGCPLLLHRSPVTTRARFAAVPSRRAGARPA